MNLTNELYPLTPSQQDIILDERWGSAEEAAGASLMGFSCFVAGDCNFRAFEQTFNWVLEHNDALRLQLVPRGRKLFQRILPYEYVSLATRQVAGEKGFRAYAEEYLHRYVRYTDERLFRAELIDCGGGSGGIVVIWHHVVADGYANAQIFRQFDTCYHAFCEGRPIALKTGSVVASFEASEKYLASRDRWKDRLFWLKRYWSTWGYSIIGGRVGADYRAAKAKVRLEGETYDGLMELARETGVSIHSLVMSLAALTTTCVTGKKCFSIYTMSHGRTSFQMKQTMGCMTLSIPLIYRYQPALSFRETAQRDYQFYLEALQHGRLPLMDHLALKGNLNLLCGGNMAHSWLQFSNMELAQEVKRSDLNITIPEKNAHPNLLTCNTYHLAGEHAYELEINYQVHKLTAEKIREVCETFRELARRVAGAPMASNGELCKGIQTCR